MKRRNRSEAGMTLIELALVIGVTVALMVGLLAALQGWRENGNRARCIMMVTNIQKAVRSYQDLNSLSPGDTVTGLQGLIFPSSGTSTTTMMPTAPACPGSGSYTYGGTAVPAIGTAYAQCSVTTHRPANTNGW